MIKRCIMIFPHFENQQIIDDIRKKYDPLAKCVGPHITLVFPFESEIDKNNLKEHIEIMLLDIKAFHISLSGITPSTLAGNYLFLNVKEGNTQIVEIHKRLYKGILKEFYPQWPKEIDFLPHMTVGNISDLNAFEMAVEETKNIDDVFETTVDTISVEIIDEDEDSIIELNIPLNICK
ncbi:2'-5' RNA ligase family protein [Clostridium sp. CF012]|uniref:2'-5' RNA ligase family protein n=1 Tax=Clostridium sp. CF012 TaxID=2843319 RepID=UPI001C0CEC55|nr:2'-5' RNA ligase family protein [Clostridium sp. CF012]MBU3142698.1 2'-5' RNA ligase family protein [Clostridium sp. CF012]